MIVEMVDLSRFRRRNRHQMLLYDKPARERHFLSIVGSVLSMVLLILALALREWAKGKDNVCNYIFGLTQVQIQSTKESSSGETGIRASE